MSRDGFGLMIEVLRIVWCLWVLLAMIGYLAWLVQ